MAKVVLYLHARHDQHDALIESAKKVASHPFFRKSALQLAVMTPRSSDLLAVPPDSDFIAHLDVVLEIVFPVGLAIGEIQTAGILGRPTGPSDFERHAVHLDGQLGELESGRGLAEMPDDAAEVVISDIGRCWLGL